jgi:hypothetical protein
MDPPQVYEQLEALLQRLGIPVRCEPFDVRTFGDLNVQGGICRVRGAAVVLVDARAPVVERVAVLAGVLAAFDLDEVFMPPQIRKLIEAHAEEPQEPLAEVIPIGRGRARPTEPDTEG